MSERDDHQAAGVLTDAAGGAATLPGSTQDTNPSTRPTVRGVAVAAPTTGPIVSERP